jgi:hypothetical protein
MFFLAGAAASNALDLISALQQTLAGKNASAPSTPPANGQSFDVSAGANGTTAPGGTSATATTPLAPTTMNALLTVQGDSQTPVVNGDAFSQKLFSMLDANGDGSISQSEFDSIFNKNGDTTKADAIFAKLDANHDGNVSPDELTNALSGQGDVGQGGQDDGGQQVHHRRHHHHGLGGLGGANSPMGGSSNPNDPFSTNSSSSSNDPFAGDTSQTVTNTDGSSTTTVTYADGSQVTMTTPASSGSGSSPSAMAHNFIERMIQHQAQMMTTQSAGQSLAISA